MKWKFSKKKLNCHFTLNIEKENWSVDDNLIRFWSLAKPGCPRYVSPWRTSRLQAMFRDPASIPCSVELAKFSFARGNDNSHTLHRYHNELWNTKSITSTIQLSLLPCIYWRWTALHSFTFLSNHHAAKKKQVSNLVKSKKTTLMGRDISSFYHTKKADMVYYNKCTENLDHT